MNKIDRRILSFIFGVLLVFSLSRCKKFLTQHPSNYLLDVDAYTNENNIYSILNGLYRQLANPSVYGEDLTMTNVDVLAQYYTGSSTLSSLGGGNYASAHSDIDVTWDSAYSIILQDNVFISHIASSADKSILTRESRDIALGEAYGIRAMLHFDLLRLYGPVYITDSTASSIKYNYYSVAHLSSFLPANEVLDSISKDLDSAAVLLRNDPVRTAGTLGSEGAGLAPFLQNRNLRLNYYSIKALQARVALYRGEKASAAKMAEAVIDETREKGLFRWSPDNSSVPGNSGFDPLFSSEIIFALFDPHLYTSYLDYFSPSKVRVLQPSLAGLASFYEDDPQNPVDFRLRSQWGIDAGASNKFYTFNKYQNSTKTNLLPMIRISELYYICAEATGDPAYLDSVRIHRGLHALVPGTADLQSEIEKEYRKEFWGEGQLFYYYKRLNKRDVPTAEKANSTTTYGPGRYVLPMPVAELIGQ